MVALLIFVYVRSRLFHPTRSNWFSMNVKVKRKNIFSSASGLSVPAVSSVTEDPDEFDEDDDSTEADDDGRIYKNPRNNPSSECPRDEEQATLLGE